MKPKKKKKHPAARKKNQNKAAKGYLIALSFFIIVFLTIMILWGKGSRSSYKKLFPDKDNRPNYTFTKEGELNFISPIGKIKKKIDVEIADTEYDRAVGLMFRESMEENQGMLFIMPSERKQAFWMKNTMIPLDMIFMDKDQKIVSIQKNTRPYSEQSYISEKPAKYVVEVIAGFANKYGIKEGDTVSWQLVFF